MEGEEEARKKLSLEYRHASLTTPARTSFDSLKKKLDSAPSPFSCRHLLFLAHRFGEEGAQFGELLKEVQFGRFELFPDTVGSGHLTLPSNSPPPALTIFATLSVAHVESSSSPDARVESSGGEEKRTVGTGRLASNTVWARLRRPSPSRRGERERRRRREEWSRRRRRREVAWGRGRSRRASGGMGKK